MNPASLSPWANHLWQSTLFAATAALLTLALRRNRASARYGIWLEATEQSLLPLSALASLGRVLASGSVPLIAAAQDLLALEEVGIASDCSPVVAPVGVC